MTYLEFHLVLVVPAIAGLGAVLALRRLRPPRRAWWSLAAVAGLALLYTSPWDNYLVRRGVWTYGADRVLGTIGWVPVEEYLFFLLQPVLTGLWLYLLLGTGRAAAAVRRPAGPPGRLPAALWLCAALAGLAMLGMPRTTYLGLVLAWAAPVLALQWLFAGGALRRLGGLAVAAVAGPTLYLWVADAVAIRLGIWDISASFTTGLRLFGLPIEEATFFLLTNLLVVQGLVMFLFPVRPFTRERRPASLAAMGPIPVDPAPARSGRAPSPS